RARSAWSTSSRSSVDVEPPSGDLLDDWVAGHDSLHRGATVLAALNRVGSDVITVSTPVLWRLVDGRGGTWTGPDDRVADALDVIRRAERRRIAAGSLPPVGLLASVRR
ncbi:hypothetical protein AB0G02_24785, partial [Actinosynnema sp. NPDC023658]|uniref:hypothetical protein n=1 Tax=Actinosynnema sp. NPDC023658 TaxID=3155465 RepID=UPI0033D18F90